MNTASDFQEAARQVVANNPQYAVEEAEIRGVTYRVFKSIPRHMREFLHYVRPQFDDGLASYIAFNGETWTFDEFCNDIKAMAHVLEKDMQIAKGQPVAVAMRNCPEMLILMMAITSVGGVVVFLNGWWTTEELSYAIEDSGAEIVFADGERCNRIMPLLDKFNLTLIGVRDGDTGDVQSYAALKNRVGSADWSERFIDTDDDMAIMYSSGTTGQPKGVVQTHRGALNAVYTWLMQPEIAAILTPPVEPVAEPPRPCALIVTPLFHVTATHPMFLLSLAAGGRVILMEKWNAEKAAELIISEKVTRFLGVPTQSADLLAVARRDGLSFLTLQYLGAGGAKRPAAQVNGLAEAFPEAQIATGWGMTETNANGIGFAGEEYLSHPGATGRLYPPVQDLKLIDDLGHEVPQGEIGEITVKSPCNMRCYLNKPEATAEILKDGWLRSGDLGMMDEDGIVTILDRKKNIIIRGGENIACLDVEGALHRHPDVIEACAFSIPHERLGEVVGAGLRLRPGARLEIGELAAFLAPHIAKFKIPERIWTFDTALPRGTTDKLDRRELRRICLDELNEKTELA